MAAFSVEDKPQPYVYSNLIAFCNLKFAERWSDERSWRCRELLKIGLWLEGGRVHDIGINANIEGSAAAPVARSVFRRQAQE
jgi:hypothetical protein